MIPVRDVIPSRTAPAVTLTLLAAMGAACLWPAVREWWLPWTANALVLWLTGGTLEDRFGHARFAALAAACATAAFIAPLLVTGHQGGTIWTAGGAAAGLIAAYLAMFPHSRILTVVPVVVGIEVTDVPAWAVFGLWAVLQGAGAWAALTWAAADPAGILIGTAAGAAAGIVGSVTLRRPERMRVDWWDPPTRPS